MVIRESYVNITEGFFKYIEVRITTGNRVRTDSLHNPVINHYLNCNKLVIL